MCPAELDFAGLDDIGWDLVAAAPKSIEASFSAAEVAEDSAGVELTVRRINGDLLDSLVVDVSGENGAIRMGGKCFDGAYDILDKRIKESGRKIIKYTPPKEEVDKWVKIAGKPVWDIWVKKMEKRGHKNAQKIMDEAIRLVKEYSKGKTDTWRDLFKDE